MADAPPPQSAPAPTPHVPASASPSELTLRALALGSLLGIAFAASSVYLGLKVGLTVSASIPIAVLSVTVFRAFGRAGILENNVVQTTGSAGESIAAGVAFTLPSLLLMGFELDLWRVTAVALLGGLLGVLLMIPLRRGLIVREHATLPYPEGTACAQVLIVGERGGASARTVFAGFGAGAAFNLLGQIGRFWGEVGSWSFASVFSGATFT
jgi:putative OPT family oligopeptide transporter